MNPPNRSLSYTKQKKRRSKEHLFCVSTDLSYRTVASRVLSAWLSLTAVFGMGTGGPSTQKALTLCQHRPILPDRRRSSIVGVIELNCRVRNGNGWTLNTNDTDYLVHLQGFEPGTHWLRVSCSTNWAKGAFPGFPYAVPSKLNKTRISYSFCSSPRSISISQLNALPHLHLWPIKLVVFKWPY